MDIEVLRRALDRERARRIQAEEMLETKSRDLFMSYEELKESNQELERINSMLELKQRQFMELFSAHDNVTKDLSIAAKLQQQILPSGKVFGNIAADGISKPAMYIAGDIYDYFQLSDTVMAFYMVDVTGHGTAPAMVSYAIHNQLNPREGGICANFFASANRFETAILDTVGYLNKEYSGFAGANHFFTMVYGLIDLETGETCFCQAGHPAPIIRSQSSNTVAALGNGGFPIGMFEEASFDCQRCILDVGDSLYVYSDGVTECFSEHGEEFGTERLMDTIKALQNGDLGDNLLSIDTELMAWNDGEIFTDDISVLAIKRMPNSDELALPYAVSA